MPSRHHPRIRRRDIKDIANALTRKLRDVTDEFLRHENRDRPEVPAEIASAPLLAPAEKS